MRLPTQALGFSSREEYIGYSNERVRKRYKHLSLLVHPDKHTQNSESTQREALKAQQLLVTASRILLDKKKTEEYIKNGTHSLDTEHDCRAYDNTIRFIRTQVGIFVNRHNNKRVIAAADTRSKVTKTTRSFIPEGYQLGGARILDSKPRPHEHAYQVDWLLKPGNLAWIKESEVARFYPEACIEYIRQLRENRATRKLANMAKNAGPITKYM